MSFFDTLRNISVKLEKKENSVFDYPVEKQKKYIERFPEPKDEIERSFFQYKCQMKLKKKITSIVLNFFSAPLFLYYLIKKEKIGESEKVDAIFFADGKPDNIIPLELREKYSRWKVIEDKGSFLSKDGKKYMKSIWKKHPFSYQLLLKSIIKIRFYDYVITSFSPKSIVVCNEYSFTSSLLTGYCRARGIKHINVMHGEKFYFMRDSFFVFDECYVWDDYYRQLLSQLRAEKEQFRISVPQAVKIESSGDISKKFDFTYYLGAESGLKLERIVENMEYISKSGFKVAIRPHPRYTNSTELAQMASELIIEDVSKITIEESLLRTKCAISLYSTVLSQAHYNGIDVMIDDVSNKEFFDKLKDRQYIMLNKSHRLLSEYLEK